MVLLKKALDDMRKEMLLHQQSHQQERADLTAKLEEATRAAKEKEEAEKAAAEGAKPQLVAGLEKVENPLHVAKKSFDWMSRQACKMARVETPEDIKRKKKFEEQQKLQKEAQEKQDSARESVRTSRASPSTLFLHRSLLGGSSKLLGSPACGSALMLPTHAVDTVLKKLVDSMRACVPAVGAPACASDTGF